MTAPSKMPLVAALLAAVLAAAPAARAAQPGPVSEEFQSDGGVAVFGDSYEVTTWTLQWFDPDGNPIQPPPQIRMVTN